MKKTTTTEQTENVEKRYIQIHPRMYHKFLSPQDMETYMELIIQSMEKAVDKEQYEKATIYKRIFDWNNKRLHEGVDSICGWNPEDSELADRLQTNESGYYWLVDDYR